MTSPRPTCQHCGVVIGVYEPIVAVGHGRVRETSRAVEPAVGTEPSELYHRACYAERLGGLPAHEAKLRTGSF